MRISASLFALFLAVTALAPNASAQSSSAQSSSAQSSLNLRSGVGYSLAGIAYEVPVTPQFSLEAGVGYHPDSFSSNLGAASYLIGVVGAKYFFRPDSSTWFVAGRLSASTDPNLPNSTLAINNFLTGGYRLLNGPWQFDAEAGISLVTSTFSDTPTMGVQPTAHTFPFPVFGLSVGYRF